MTADDPARRRFFILQAVRLSGLALLLVGILATQHAIALPTVVGYALVPIGLVLFAVLPVRLARRWRTPRA